jgi:hypothetical protein
MRAYAPFAFALFVPFLGGCSSSGEEADDADQAVVGGDDDPESATVFLFASEAPKIKPSCIGAMISPRMAVTLRSCAKEGLIVGRADMAQGRTVRAVAKKVHVPQTGEIAVLELDRDLAGSYAQVTHAPLAQEYAISGIASVDGGFWWWNPNEGEGSTVQGRLVSETDTNATLKPNEGQLICATDIGAPVCSTTSTGWFDGKTCGLSALLLSAGQETKVEQGKAAPPAGCSAGDAQVVKLGPHAEFLKGLAPEAFRPYVRGNYVSPGLWGFDTAGTVQSCKIETSDVPTIAPAKELRLKASAKFTLMAEHARAVGEFGLALKSDPTKVTWLPAKASRDSSASYIPTGEGPPAVIHEPAFDSTFEGRLTPATDGEFVLAFRVSANGGETWTVCGKDGSTSPTIDPAKSTPVSVTPDGSAPTQPPQTNPPTSTTPPGATPAPTTQPPPVVTTGASADSADSEDGAATTEPTPTPSFTPRKKKKSNEDGCSASPAARAAGTRGASNAGTFGLMLGLAALAKKARRRRG